MTIRHFLQMSDCSQQELNQIIAKAIEVKQQGDIERPAIGKTLAMIFEKPSTRTRVSFEVGFSHLGGHALFLDPGSLQLGRGEPISDTSKVISSMVDMIMIRTFDHEKLLELAHYSSVPVINGLTDSYHPCQILADIMTFVEQRGDIAGRRVAFIGDCKNNVCASYIEAASLFGFELVLSCPEKYQPETTSDIRICRQPEQAIEGADMVVTDVWTSMGDEQEQQQRLIDFAGYQITSTLLDYSHNPLFLHCLPAHRGEEVDDMVLDDPRSGAWQASENRLHAQKELMRFLLHVN